jgi:hypothetical protein
MMRAITKCKKEYSTMTTRNSRRSTHVVNGHSCRDDIVQAVDERIDRASERFGRVLPVRFDFTLPVNYPQQHDNERFGRMLDSLNQHLRRKGVGREYVWTREVGDVNERAHYHLLMLLNGRKLQSSHTVHKKAKELWERALRCNAPGCVHRSQPASGKNEPRENWLDRNRDDFQDAKEDLKAWGGYVSKTEQKGKAPRKTREFGCSQMQSSNVRQEAK